MPQVMKGWGDNGHKVVVSLCDYSGNWPRPWNTEGGYTVLHYDLKHGDDVLRLSEHHVLIDAMAYASGHGKPVEIACVLAAPPCTDFTVSGAQYWPAKDADGRTAHSLAVLLACVMLARNLSPGCWALENPVGRIPKLRPDLGKPLYYFNPCDYCRWAGVNDAAAEVQRERYTKKTGMWGRHREPERAGLAPIRVCSQGSWVQKLGGKSERTKELRSMTPLGFARAFYVANSR